MTDVVSVGIVSASTEPVLLFLGNQENNQQWLYQAEKFMTQDCKTTPNTLDALNLTIITLAPEPTKNLHVFEFRKEEARTSRK